MACDKEVARCSTGRTAPVGAAAPPPEGSHEPTVAGSKARLQVVADYTRLSAVQAAGRAGHGRALGPQYPGVAGTIAPGILPAWEQPEECAVRSGVWAGSARPLSGESGGVRTLGRAHNPLRRWEEIPRRSATDSRSATDHSSLVAGDERDWQAAGDGNQPMPRSIDGAAVFALRTVPGFSCWEGSRAYALWALGGSAC
jgi:hypothetical protein